MGNSAYKSSLESLDFDRSSQVNDAYQLAKGQLANVHTQNLEGVNRARPSELQSSLENLNTDFVQKLSSEKASIDERKAQVKQKHLIFLAVEWVLIILGVVLAMQMDSPAFGVILAVIGVVCIFVFKSISGKEAAALASEWQGFFDSYIARFGGAETLHEPATGLYKDIDDLYLASMTEQERGFEMQSRQMKKQMEASAEQAAQSQAMAAAQMEQLKQMNANQKANNMITLLKK